MPICRAVAPTVLRFSTLDRPNVGSQNCQGSASGFDKLLVQIAHDNKNVIYVPTQGTLTRRSEWDNELHPAEGGFRKIAKKFLDTIRTKFSGRI